ncbi:MAG: site-2 protease family protein [Phycisphaerales bacterium]
MPDERWDTGIHYDERPQTLRDRVRAVLRRVFGDGENVLAWGFPLYRAFGIRVRIHLFLVVLIAFEIVRSIRTDEFGLVFMGPLMGAMLVLVLLHEYGHCFACRLVAGEADEIMLWPLGGLATCRPPHHWKADLITTLGGPAVNLILYPVLSLAVYIATRSAAAVFYNPFDPGSVLAELSTPVNFALVCLWSLHYINLVLLLFNLVPMFPMDGGRILQALVWRKSDHAHSVMVATTTAFVAAGVLATAGMVFGSTTLLAIAAFGAFVSWQERQRHRLLLAEGPLPSVPPIDDDADRRRDHQAAADQAELDRILAKISAEGMDALTARERRSLKRASRRGRES